MESDPWLWQSARRTLINEVICSHRGRREKSDRQRQPQQQQPKTRIKRGWNIEEEEEWIPTRFLLKPTRNVCLELFENVSSLHPCWLEVWLLSHTTFSLHSVWYDGILFCYIKQLDETPPDPNHVVILTHFLHSTSLLTGPYWTNHRWHKWVRLRFAESSHMLINSQKLYGVTRRVFSKSVTSKLHLLFEKNLAGYLKTLKGTRISAMHTNFLHLPVHSGPSKFSRPKIWNWSLGNTKANKNLVND